MFFLFILVFFFFFKQKTAYEMRISDWSSDVCSSDLFAVRTEPETSSSSPPPPRTSAKWPSFFRCRSRQLPPEAHESCRRAPAPLSASISNALFQDRKSVV